MRDLYKSKIARETRETCETRKSAFRVFCVFRGLKNNRMKIYTKTGDTGTTDLIGGRLNKDHDRIEAYGTLDELNSWIGLAMSVLSDPRDADVVSVLIEIQQDLFACGSDLARLDSTREIPSMQAKQVTRLEQLIDHYTLEIREIEGFILPGGTQAATLLHVCRTVARRAERRIVTLRRQDTSISAEVVRYINRLSDLLFVLARVCNARAGIPDLFYRNRKDAPDKKNA